MHLTDSGETRFARRGRNEAPTTRDAHRRQQPQTHIRNRASHTEK